MNKIQHFRMIALIIALIGNMALFSTPVTAAAIAMTDMQGNKQHLENLVGQGKWAVFKIWASDCHICQQTIHYLSDFKKAYPAADVYGISLDGQQGKAQAQKFIQKFKLTFPNLLADYMAFSDYLYAEAGDTLRGTPTMIVYNPQGQLVAVQPGAVMAQDLISFIQRQEAESP